MRENQTFQKALNSLTHPVTLAAIILLLLSDHWLRLYHPSWLTGKLGDFAWLIFAPHIAALIFSFVPLQTSYRVHVVGISAFAFIGMWFVTAKTWQPMHALTTSTLESIIGWQVTLRMDVTDLIALPGLGIGWWIWQRADEKRFSRQQATYFALGMGVLGTVATSPVTYDWGVICILQSGTNLVTSTQVGQFVSGNGGLSWTITTSSTGQVMTPQCAYPRRRNHKYKVIDPTKPQVNYLISRGGAVEQSTDGGRSWAVDHDLSYLQQEIRRALHRGQHEYPTSTESGPFDGKIHSGTGNLVLAMGADGVLVRLADGSWQWVAVGPYSLPAREPAQIADILIYEFALALSLGLLLLTSSLSQMPCLTGTILTLGWLLWFECMLFRPALWNYLDSWLFHLNYYIIILPLTIGVFFTFVLIIKPGKAKNLIIWLSSAAGVLFFLPFVLWSLGTIPQYSNARGIAIGLVILVLGLAFAIQRLNPGQNDDLPSPETSQP